MRLYSDLAPWYHLVTPPEEYAAESAHIAAVAEHVAGAGARTLLELGSGGGCNAFHLKTRFDMTLSDLSAAMLAASKAINPDCAHVEGDMRTLRLSRLFDVVLIHDALCYLLTEGDLAAAIATAAAHLRKGGAAIFIPDHVRENFAPGERCGGHDGTDGRAVRYLEWAHDPDPDDHLYVVDYAFLLREANGETRVVHDRHVEAAHPRALWERLIAGAGLDPVDISGVPDPHAGEHAVFAARSR